MLNQLPLIFSAVQKSVHLQFVNNRVCGVCMVDRIAQTCRMQEEIDMCIVLHYLYHKEMKCFLKKKYSPHSHTDGNTKPFGLMNCNRCGFIQVKLNI